MTTLTYITPLIGSGTHRDPFHCKIDLYIDIMHGDRYISSDYAQGLAVAVVTASDAAHAAIASDSSITEG